MMHDLKSRVLPALLSGTARHPLAGDALASLSLTGQALRFERPVAPPAFAVEPVIRDERVIVPDRLRRPLQRLLAAKPGMVTGLFPAAIARAMHAGRWRPHPFDLPKLDSLIRSHGAWLGAEAMAFAQRDAAPDQQAGYFEPDAIDEANWSRALPAQRQGFIEAVRRRDAAAGRALVEAVWSGENADVRVRLLTALREGLSGEDTVFLQGLAKDRAPRVRELAQRLLARLPGAGGDDPALHAVMERIKKGQTGLLKKRATLALELPATVAAHGAPVWVNEAFGDIGLDELAAALGLTIADMIRAAEKDDNLLLAFVIMASHDKRFDMLDIVVGLYLPDAWEVLARSNFSDVGTLTADERARWAQILVRPQTWVKDVPLWGLVKLYQLLDGPAPAALMRDILNCRPWRALLTDPDKLTGDMVDVLAVLCSTEARGILRAQLAALDAPKTANALLFLDIVDALEVPNV